MTEYEEARAEFDEAFAIFNPIDRAYTNIKIPIHERPTTKGYLAARKGFEDASIKFDKVFAKEAGGGGPMWINITRTNRHIL